jgi:hypothetical protein
VTGVQTCALPISPNLTYTPAPNYFGTDSLGFVVGNGSLGSANATVTIHVTEVNDPPTVQPQSITTLEDAPIAITLTSTDQDGPPATYAISTPPTRGTLSGSGATRTYTPNRNFYGKDSFAFTANDGVNTSPPADHHHHPPDGPPGLLHAQPLLVYAFSLGSFVEIGQGLVETLEQLLLPGAQGDGPGHLAHGRGEHAEALGEVGFLGQAQEVLRHREGRVELAGEQVDEQVLQAAVKDRLVAGHLLDDGLGRAAPDDADAFARGGGRGRQVSGAHDVVDGGDVDVFGENEQDRKSVV